MAEPLRIALAGVGTVGAGVIRLLDDNAALVRARAGREIRVVAVSARDRAFVKLPEPLKPLYYLVRPVRLVVQHGRRVIRSIWSMAR